ncbi:MAG: protein kinase [bacterium]|nr:protein kinase [bacterium]
MSEEYKLLDNYLIFKELDSDSIGTNYRAGEIDKDSRKAKSLCLLTRVYPFLSENPDVWKRVNILLEGIKKSNIPNLYSPEETIKKDDKALLVYPKLKGRTFEKVLEDSSEKDMPINFDLTFSIAIAIADLIDIGSSIVVSGQKSFHGFLTPDNIIIDYDGKILLKNYGIYPYLSKNEEIFSAMVEKYGAWLAPEFLRKERPIPQSDIYHLGYIIYRILTGEYFSYSEGEDFESKFSNISFNQYIPSSDTVFITNIINFFKKTLNPDPAQRFTNMKEFKDYISHYFHIEELSSVTFNLAYFMNSLYLETMEEEAKVMEKEAAYAIPEPKKEVIKAAAAGKDNSHLAEDILAGLDEHERGGSKMKILIPIVAAIIILAVIGFFYIQSAQKSANLESERQRQKTEKLIAQLKNKQDAAELKHKQELEALKQKETDSEEERKKIDDKIKQLEVERAAKKKKEEEKIAAEQEKLRLETEEKDRVKAAADAAADAAALKEKQVEDARKKKEAEELARQKAEEQKIKEGQLVPLNLVDVKPEKIKGKAPKFSYRLTKKYAGNALDIRSMVLIDENGTVTSVRILSNIPEEIKNGVLKALKTWQYKPAISSKVKVKVWLTVSLKIKF